MNLQALKEKARRHEQKEEWRKALDTYREVVHKHREDEPLDITLFNRIGDIQTRLKEIQGAVQSYEKAIELYLEAELPNNAIAICKKVLRNLPDRSIFFLRMGQIRGNQGFMTDAKQNFLTYAERMTAAGDLDAAMDALLELVDLVPDDVEIRMGLASQLESHERTHEALVQYTEAYRYLVLQERLGEAESLAGRLQEMDPEVVLPAVESIVARPGTETRAASGLEALGLGGFELGSGVTETEPDLERVELFVDPGEMEAGGRKAPVGVEFEEEGAGIASGAGMGGGSEEDVEEEVQPLPMLGMEDDETLPASQLEEPPEEEPPFLQPPSPGDRVDLGEGLPTLEMDYEEAEEVLRAFGIDEGEAGEAAPAFRDTSDEGAEPLPILGFEEDRDAVAEALPTLPVLEEREGAGPGDDELPPTFDLEEETERASEEARERALEDAAFASAFLRHEEEGPAPDETTTFHPHHEAAERGDLDEAIRLVRAEIEATPDDLALYQRQVEYAFRKGDHSVLLPAYLDLAHCLLRSGSATKARAVFQQVLSISPGHDDALRGLRELEGVPAGEAPVPVASSEEYVDLGALILGEDAEKTTRWQVTAESPSGDDQADFAKMLSQFKQKVSEHVDADDLSAHHDLGTAYLEMGLLDEAIGEFQMALRASPHHLPTHEVMGRCWMEKGQPDMAVRALERALHYGFEVEDELIGIYYIMGRAQEELGNTEEAVEFYEKVFSLDINFEDVTERLRSLR